MRPPLKHNVIIYAATGSSKIFNVALRRKCLPTRAVYEAVKGNNGSKSLLECICAK